MRTVAIVTLLGLASAVDYSTLGSNWGGLCLTGTAQSPIQIDAATAVSDSELQTVQFGDAGDGTAKLVPGSSYTVENLNLEVVEGDYKGFITEVHLHFAPTGATGSEHLISMGDDVPTQYDLELQLVSCAVPPCTAENELRVFSTLFAAKGQNNPFIGRVIDGLEEQSAADANATAATVAGLDAKDIVDKYDNYYRYTGSLTTPDCDESVEWYVRTGGTMSESQIAALRALSVVGDQETGNFRAPQDLSGRVVTKHCVACGYPLWSSTDSNNSEMVTASIIVFLGYTVLGATVIYCLAKGAKAKYAERSAEDAKTRH